MSEQDISEKSAFIANRLTDIKEFNDSRFISCYMNFKSEVKTDGLIQTCLLSGKRVAVPKVVRNEQGKKEMIMSELIVMSDDLEKGTWGILEPRLDRIREIDPKELDCVLLPGVAFDLRRNRIGYGAGYYDYFLTRVKKTCYRIGMAFELQIVDTIPAEGHDIPLDRILTESRLI